MIKRLCLILVSCISLFVTIIGCASNGGLIPGKSTIETKKIYNEYLSIADIYFGMEKYDKAIEYYKLALNSKENYWGVYYKLARTYTLQSKWNEALPMYETLLKRDPENNALKVSIAYIYAMSNETDKAIKTYEDLIKNNPENAEYYQNIIAVYLAQKDYESSVKYFETFRQQFPDNQNGEKLQKEIEKLGKETGAITEEEKSEETKTEVPEA